MNWKTDPIKVIKCLIKNGFTHELFTSRYVFKIANVIVNSFSYEKIYDDPASVIDSAQKWFRTHSMFFQPWDGDDDVDQKTKVKYSWQQPSNSSQNSENTIKKTCYGHEWKQYTGLREVFFYCEKCNEKKK